MITYFQAIIIAIIQGATELFPVSSLGHSVLIANLFGWKNILNAQTAEKSTFLTFLVVLHVATAIALIVFYRKEWSRIVAGFMRSVRTKQLNGDSDATLAWMLIAATIPTALVGMLLDHTLRKQFGTPIFAIIFLVINGILLIKGDEVVRAVQRQRPRQRQHLATANFDDIAAKHTAKMVSDHLSFSKALLVGFAQTGALFAGISRSGVTMLAGLRSGLSHEDAARFSFLLATPIILGAGLYKLPTFLGADGDSIRGQALLGGVIAGIAAYISVKYLDKYFRTRSLKPFGYYCIGFGIFMLLLGIVRGHF